MKLPKLLLGLLLALYTLSLSAQTTGFNYQAVLRTSNYAPIGNQSGTATVSILNPVGTELYRETHNISTDQLGLFNLVIGKGTNPVGNFATLDWASGGRFVKISVTANGNTYDFFPTELQAVPYAKVAEKTLLGDGDADPQNELQTITLTGNQLSLSNGGGSVNLPVSTDAQSLTLNGQNLSISNGNTVALPAEVDGSVTNEIQALSLSGNELSLSNGGGSVTLPNGGGTGWTSSGPTLTTTDNAQKVGIGITTPLQKLHVHDADNSFAWMQMSSGASGATGGDGAFVGTVGNEFKIENCEAGNITLGNCSSTDQLVVSPNGNVGIGVVGPPSKLSVRNSNLLTKSFDTRTFGGTNLVSFSRANGTQAAPTTILNNETLSNLLFEGHNGNSYSTAAFINSKATENWNSTSSGGNLSFFTTPNGSTNPTSRMTIDQDGQVNIKNNGFSNSTVEIENTNASNIANTLVVRNSGNRSGGPADGQASVDASMTNTQGGSYSCAVRGINFSTDYYGVGVIGIHNGYGYGIYGKSDDGYAIYGQTIDGYAGYFNGKVVTNGKVGVRTSTPESWLHIHDLNDPAGTNMLQVGDDTYFADVDQQNILGLYGKQDNNLGGISLGQSGNNLIRATGPTSMRISTTPPGSQGGGSIIFKTPILGIENYWDNNSSGADRWDLSSDTDLVLHRKNGNNTSIKGRFDETSGVYTSLSDRRYKTNIQPLVSVLQEVMQLRPSSYEYIEQNPEKKRSIGFIAQEVQELFPGAVSAGKDHIPTPDPVLTLDYTYFSTLSIKAIQEQQQQIEAQQAEIAALKAELAKQSTEILARLEKLETAKAER